MNKSEFTELFDLDRFKAGEPALFEDSGDVNYLRFFRPSDGSAIDECGFLRMKSDDLKNGIADQKYSMRPAAQKINSDDKDGWIQHDGGECPIKWAKNVEFKVLFKNGVISDQLFHADCLSWNSETDNYKIVSYCLTDGWVPVLNGECPDLPGTGPWEWKFRDGIINKAHSENTVGNNPCLWKHLGVSSDIVAVRRVPIVKPVLTEELLDKEAEIMCSKMKPLPISEILSHNQKPQKIVKPPFRAIGQNEIIRIAGLAINGVKEKKTIFVYLDVAKILSGRKL